MATRTTRRPILYAAPDTNPRGLCWVAFPAPRGNRFGHLEVPQRLWKGLVASAGLEKPWPTPYAARHAYRTFSQGVAVLDAVKEQQGWKTAKMSDHYRDRLDSFQRAALVAMEGALLPPAPARETNGVH